MISILIAARNEEATIINCLQSVSKLNFPGEPFEVLIGNDASEDRTAALVQDFIQDKPNFRLFTIYHTIGLARGKANVLAQLVHQANGEIICITDADVQLPPTWLAAMYSAYKRHIAVAAGITVVRGKALFHKLQALEWIYASGIVNMFACRQIPVTAMGNNMLVTREAYLATGGYENLPFSITEDYALFHAVVAKGYKFAYLLNEEVKVYTEPMPTLLDLLGQRKRWMYGALQLPLYIKCIFLCHALLLPFLIGLLLVLPEIALIILSVKFFIDGVYLFWVLKRINELALCKYVLLYEGYMMLFSLATLIFYCMPGKLRWKGREYEVKTTK